MLFLGLNLIMKKIFNLPLSKKNLWADKDLLICTELYSSLLELELGTITFPKVETITMTKPHELFLVLSSLPFLATSEPKPQILVDRV